MTVASHLTGHALTDTLDVFNYFKTRFSCPCY
jgi:hypothetical protein